MQTHAALAHAVPGDNVISESRHPHCVILPAAINPFLKLTIMSQLKKTGKRAAGKSLLSFPLLVDQFSQLATVQPFQLHCTMLCCRVELTVGSKAKSFPRSVSLIFLG